MVIGGVLGVLMAPHRGDITRRKIVRRAGETKDQVSEVVEDHISTLKAKKVEVEDKLEAFTEEQETQNGDKETDS
jgi:gas vesicle protein